MESPDRLRLKFIEQTRKKLIDSVSWDLLAMQAISSLEELDKIINQTIARTREWYAWHNPETAESIKSNEKFIELITAKTKRQLLEEAGIKQSIGKDLDKEDLGIILDLAKTIKQLIDIREKETMYLEKILKEKCPNVHNILGTTLTAKLLKQIGGFYKLSKTPAPVIQIIGAEKSLFKHMTGKGKSPKYGVIQAHPLIAKVSKSNKGKMARAIADKVAIAARIDYFKGKPIDYRKELEEKAESLVERNQSDRIA